MINNAVPLSAALRHIGHIFNMNPIELDMASRDDPHGGYHAAYEDGFPVGSMWRVEGQFLYALVRALDPKRVLELGTSHGCSATHISQALYDNGRLEGLTGIHCIDNGSQVGEIGDMIPIDLRDGYVTILQTSVEEFIPRALDENWQYDFILEDAMHSPEQVALVWGAAERLLNPGGMIVSHDAMHMLAGAWVQEGIARAGYADKAVSVLIEPADCGFAVWRKRFA